MLLPFFPTGVTHITPELAVKKEDGWVTYFNAFMPVFRHEEKDIRSFKMITSQFYVMGVTKQADIVRAFGVKPLLVKRSVKLFREKGPQGFFEAKGSRGPGVLTKPVLEQVQELLDQGASPSEISQRFGLKVDTVRKAILHGRLYRRGIGTQGAQGTETGSHASSKSDRSAEDSDAEMG